MVGVGASAGGLEALTRLLKAVPPDTGMAFVLVQHLSPTHDSALARILSRATAMPVVEVTDEPSVEADHVYVIPPNRDMVIVDGHLVLSRRNGRGAPHPIDLFFTALARDQRELAIGIVLSGTGTDGTLGLEDINAEGGLTFAQDATAHFTEMPRSAIASGAVDFTLAPEGIASEIARIARHPALVRHDPADGATADRGAATDKSALAPILRALRTATGVDFSSYKTNTLARRIARRMLLRKVDGLVEYDRLMRGDPEEVEALFQDILINVTSFFRDPEMFGRVAALVVPALRRNQAKTDPVRIWVVGCASGEEAYSLAILFAEAEGASPGGPPVQIFATDLDLAAVDHARAGVYASERTRDVSPERLRRFFIPVEGGHRVAKSIREMCVFAQHNVLADPPFSRLDLVSCRNVLIYMEPPLQHEVLPLLHFALKPGGYLLLGSSETVGPQRELFQTEDANARIFTRRPGHLRRTAGFPRSSSPVAKDGGRRRTTRVASVAATNGANDLLKAADRLLLARFAPASVLVTADLEILQFRGQTDPYLVPAQGTASFNLVRMARPELRGPLLALVRRVRKEGAVARASGLRVEHAGRSHGFDLEIVPLKATAAAEAAFLVLFEAVPPPDGGPPAEVAAPAEASPDGSAPDESPEAVIGRLERELIETRESLDALVEEQDAANEELQSVNEESQSANEELQSIIEELETSKEEIQSSNEELRTVNDELNSRNRETNELNADLRNLLDSVEVGIVMVDRELHIRRFSPSAGKLLEMNPSDVGRLVTDVRILRELADVGTMMNEAIASSTVLEREVEDRDGHWHLLRIRPSFSSAHAADGAVLLLVGIDRLKHAEQAIARALDQMANTLATVREPMLVLDAAFEVESGNASYYRHFGVAAEATVGRSLFALSAGAWDTPALRGAMESLLPRRQPLDELRIEREFPGLGLRIMLLNARRIEDPAHGKPRILLAIEDVTERKHNEDALRESEARFSSIFDQATAGVAQTDLDARFVLVNDRFCEIVGHPRARLLTLGMADVLPPEDAETLRAQAGQLGAGVARSFVTEQRFVRADGSIAWVHCDLAPIRDVAGDVRHLVVAIADISERIRLERELERRVEELDALDSAKGRFLAVLSHELRSPIAAIRGWLSILQRPDTGDEDRRRGLDVIDRNTRLQAQLIGDLLEAHRISSGKISLDLAVVDLAEVIEAAIAAAEPAAGAHAITLDLVEGAGPAYVSADGSRLQQVFGNLLSNALKFTPEGGRIQVAVRLAGGFVEASVTDFGEGIHPEALPHLFDSFRQAESATNRGHGGLGLGLSIARQLVQLHGGTIQASSEGKGHGATFRVALPACSEEPRIPVLLPDSAAEVAERSLTGVMVLVVDDDPDAREPVRRTLEAAGAEVITVATAQDALVAVREQRPDVLVCDIAMPGQNGYELLRAIRKLPPHAGGELAAIALTSHGTGVDRERAFDAGFETHLHKPVEPGLLVASVEALAGSDP